MGKREILHDIAWIASEVFYYLGLVCSTLLIPALALIFWLLSLTGKSETHFPLLLLAWMISVLLFISGVLLKNRCYNRAQDKEK